MESQILSFPFLLSALLLIFTVLGIKKKRVSKYLSTPKIPPGPWKLPFLGNFHQLVSPVPHQRLRDLAKKYGPIMQLKFGEVSTVVISIPEIAKEVLKLQELNFPERPPLLIGDLAFYNRKDLLFAPYGDYWRWIRKLSILELLSAKRVQSFRSIREEEVINFTKTISSFAGSPINITQMFYSLANGIMAKICIGKKSKAQEAFLPIIKEILIAGAGLNLVDLFPSAKLLHMFSRTKLKIKRAHLEADKILEDIINERRAIKAGDNDLKGILDVLLNLQDSEESAEFPMANENIKAIIMDMFLAGSDTTPIILEWALSEMIRDQRVMTRAQNEVREIFKDKGFVDESDLNEAKYLKMIIKETLRLHPPVTLLPRECIQSCKLHGYDIHQNSKAIINVWAIGRDPNYWTEAEKFYPERFVDFAADYSGSPDFEFLPFGGGKRICPGIFLGTKAIESILAHLLYHFDWKLPNGVKNEDLDMSEEYSSVVGRKQNLIVISIPRPPSTVG